MVKQNSNPLIEADVIAFDADDTLWHNETIFSVTQESFKQLLVDDVDAQSVDRRLAETELKNLKHFGYGIKGFILSMIETALDITDNGVDAKNIRRILELGQEMLAAPVELLNHVEETISELSTEHRLILVTKGDLFDQESKLARSGARSQSNNHLHTCMRFFPTPAFPALTALNS